MAAASSEEPISIVSRASIRVIAESVGISQLKDEVADALAPDVEYRLRDLVQEAIKFQKAGRRDTLTTEDINYALRLRACEPLYGFTSPDPPRFCRAVTPGVFYLEDPELNLADLLADPLPRVPVEPSFTTHWLAVNGIQPTIPQNPTDADVATAAASRKRPRDDDGAGAGQGGGEASLVVPLAKHALTEEEQRWLDRVTSAVQSYQPSGEDALVSAEAARTLTHTLKAVANDPSTLPLSPHLCALVASEVHSSLRCLPRLTAAMRLLGAMLRSLSLALEPYLHQVMPAVLTCLVGKRLCASPWEDHWSLRHHAATLVHALLLRFKDKYEDLQPRVAKTLLDALYDSSKPLTTHYGALIGLSMLGPIAVHSLLMPSLPSYVAGLAHWLDETGSPPTAPDAAANGSGSGGAKRSGGGKARAIRRLEALRVHAACVHIAGVYYFRHGDLFTPPVPPSQPTDRSDGASLSAPNPSGTQQAAAAIAAAAVATGKTVPMPPPPRNRKGNSGAAGAAATGGGASGAGAPTPPAPLLPVVPAEGALLPQMATSYDVVRAEFGACLEPHSWPREWRRRSRMPGLLNALL